MDTDPHINIKGIHLLASLLGALVAMIIPILFILLLVLGEIFYPPENPENDGYIRGFAVVLGLMPLFFVFYFTYYIFLSLKPRLSLKKAFSVALSVATLIGFGFCWAMSENAQIIYTAITGLSMFGFLGFSLCTGTWAWYKKLNT